MREGQGKLILSVIIALTTISVSAQEIKVRGGFMEDSLVIGQNFHYWLVAEYPPSMEMVFPDSNANFSPFEWADKQYFPTKLIGEQAYDSVIYTLQSFEIDPIQYLQLNAYVLNEEDSIEFDTPIDSIFLAELAPVVTDTTTLKTNLDYQAVDRQFNFPLLYYIIGGLAILIVVFFVIFGKPIIRYFKLKRLTKEYMAFSSALDSLVKKLRTNPSKELAESALTHWKKYQKKLDKVDYTTLTTKEILSLKFAKELEAPLKSIDRAIYGNHIDPNLYQEFQLIENFAKDRYNQTYEKIKNDEYEEPQTKNEVEVLKQTKMSDFDISTENLKDELLNGGRLVIYYYTVSIVFLTFRRSSKVLLLKRDESAVTKGLPYTIISFLFGWWGIPWGIIHTIQSLYVNLNGGKEVTDQIIKR